MTYAELEMMWQALSKLAAQRLNIVGALQVNRVVTALSNCYGTYVRTRQTIIGQFGVGPQTMQHDPEKWAAFLQPWMELHNQTVPPEDYGALPNIRVADLWYADNGDRLPAELSSNDIDTLKSVLITE